jgi:hypothetical protein
MRLCAKFFAFAVVAALVFAGVARAQTGDTTKNDTLMNNLFVPVGEKAIGFTTSYRENGKQKKMFFQVGLLERKDIEHVQMQNAKVTTYDDQEHTDMVLLLPVSIFDLKTRVLTSDKQFVLQKTDFEIMGDTLDLDTVAKHATITGKIKMIIYNFQIPAKQEPAHE